MPAESAADSAADGTTDATEGAADDADIDIVSMPSSEIAEHLLTPPAELLRRAGHAPSRPARRSAVHAPPASRPPSSAGPPSPMPLTAARPEPDGRHQRRFAIVGGILAVVVIALWLVRPLWQQPPTPLSDAGLVLTSNTVRVDDSYIAYASGFDSGETIELSRTGPTTGTIGQPGSADEAGDLRQGPISVRDLPGTYKIVARGEKSGRVATAQLLVVAAR